MNKGETAEEFQYSIESFPVLPFSFHVLLYMSLPKRYEKICDIFGQYPKVHTRTIAYPTMDTWIFGNDRIAHLESA